MAEDPNSISDIILADLLPAERAAQARNRLEHLLREARTRGDDVSAVCVVNLVRDLVMAGTLHRALRDERDDLERRLAEWRSDD
jgi:hypothetical protein